jgi:gluconolactonase
LKVYDINGTSVRNGKTLAQLTDRAGGRTAPDGVRCDVDGNIWCGAAPGVQILAPDGTPLGMIRLPENCANICFGGAKRTRLFMAASQSLYSVYVGVKGAHIA